MTNINIMMDGEFAEKIHRYAFLTSIVTSKFDELNSATTRKEKKDTDTLELWPGKSRGPQSPRAAEAPAPHDAD